MTRLNYIVCSILLLIAFTATAGAPQKKHAKAFAPQGDWLKKDMVIDPSKMKNFHFSTDDITDPQEREALRERMRGNAKRDNSVAAMHKENEPLYTVKCIFRGQVMPYFAIYHPGFFLESKTGIWYDSGETEIYYFQVPAGTYDLYAQCWSDTEGMEGLGNIVHENVVVESDTEVEFFTDELTEKTVIKPLLRDGREAVLPVGIYLDHEPWFEYDYSNATATRLNRGFLFFREGCEYINQNHTPCGNYGYQCPEEGPMVEYPGVPAYCYFADQMTQPVANSSPILALMTQVNTYDDATIFLIYPNAYIGRYGEVRNCDQWTLHTIVNIDGKKAFDSADDGNLENWCIENSTDSHQKGIVEATFTNRNVLVDETIPGYNITSIKVDERNDDKCTPTPQMLIFKNTAGAITDRFDKAEDGIIEFSAGDFNWVNTGEKFYYTCSEAEITVECAPYGTGSFTEIDVEEIPENYYMPGFGYFYRGSLANVTEPSENGWYDLRFTLTDKAGNEMVQRISPAFRIDANVGVTSPSVDGLRVWTAGGSIIAAGEGITGMELYAPDGKLIAKGSGAALDANGYRGIAIVRVMTADGASSTHKLAL